MFEFDVVSRSNGENHYRVQKLERLNNKKTEVSTGSTKIGTLPVNETSVSYVNNIPQTNTNVKSSGTLSNINNMQNNENNTSRRIINDIEELNDSSFSLNKNQIMEIYKRIKKLVLTKNWKT